jgi:AraC-like DNA-binding protein
MRTVLVEPIQLRSIHFAHERLDATDRARQFFNIFQCPVYFGRNHNAFFIPVEALKLKLKHGDAFIKDMMEHRANELLKKRQESVALTDEVARLIAMMILDGVPTRDMVAEQLGMSGRSLHRKLQQIDSSYQKIFDSVRWEMAKEKLLEGDESLNKIAGFLSFGSHQAFLRWFKQMTGMNPGEFRKKNGGLKWIE